MKNSITLLLGASLLIIAGSCTSNNTKNNVSQDQLAPELLHDSTQDQNAEASKAALKNSAVFVTADKKTIKTEELKGKVVFMNFWATWCPPCIREMPSIQKLYDKFKQNENIVFLIVEIDENQQGAQSFMAKNKLSLPVVYPYGDIPQDWLSDAIPSTVILDKEGNIASRKEGLHDFATKEMEDFIQNLVNQ